MSLTDIESIEEIGPWSGHTFNPQDWVPALPSHFSIERPPSRIGHHARSTSESFANRHVFVEDDLERTDISPRIIQLPLVNHVEILDGVVELQNQQEELLEQIEMLERAHEELDNARNELLRVLMEIEDEEGLPQYEQVEEAPEYEEESDSSTSSESEEEVEHTTRYNQGTAFRGLGIHGIGIQMNSSTILNCMRSDRLITIELDANGDPYICSPQEYIPDR